MTAHKLADDALCPSCSAKLDGATVLDADSKPHAGDISVCCHCGLMLQYTDEQGHVQHLAASVFKGLPLPVRKQLTYAQREILAALKGGRL
jgi:hypothetical protein